MIHLQVKLHVMELIVRDIQESDIQEIVDYWHKSEPKFLESINVDISKIVSEEETARIFRLCVPENRQEGDRITLVACHGDRVVGYTNLNFFGDKEAKEAYAHVHTIDPKYRSKGVAAFVFKQVVHLFFSHFGLRTLKLQTSASNTRINNLLRRQGLLPVNKIYMEKPDGMAKPGYFYVYDVPKDPFLMSKTE